MTGIRDRDPYRFKQLLTTAIQCTVANALDCCTLVQWLGVESPQVFIVSKLFVNGNNAIEEAKKDSLSGSDIVTSTIAAGKLINNPI